MNRMRNYRNVFLSLCSSACLGCAASDGATVGQQAEERKAVPATLSELGSDILDGDEVDGKAGLLEILTPDPVTPFLWHSCTATMIGPTLILTAAHCFDEYVQGSYEPIISYYAPGREADDPELWPAVTVSPITHPLYTYLSASHDIGILRLDDPNHSRWPNTDYHDYVRVHRSNGGIVADSDVRYDMYGRGHNTDTGGGVGTLRKGRFAFEDLHATYGEMDMAYFGWCHGDSGGPMMVQNEGHELVTCVGSTMDDVDGECVEHDVWAFDDAYCSRTIDENVKDFLENVTDVECANIDDNGGLDYLRCFELPFISEVSDGDGLPRALAVAVASAAGF
jgi:hypothetical protein